MFIGSEAVGSFKPLLQNGLLNAVNKSGAVSPATRATASITPVAMPGAAVRSITRTVARHLGTPSPSAASRSDSGTNLSSSSVVRVTVGNISTPSATPPANAEKCLACSTTNAYTKMPTVIDGTPDITSALKRTHFAKRDSPNSAKYTPASTPGGMPNTQARNTSFSVPTRALAIPPPVSPTGFGSSVQKL